MQACGKSYNGEGVEGTQLSLPATQLRSTSSTSPIPQKLSVGTMETIIYLNNLCLL